MPETRRETQAPQGREPLEQFVDASSEAVGRNAKISQMGPKPLAIEKARKLGIAIYKAASKFLELLHLPQRERLLFPDHALFSFDDESRYDWYYLPASLIPRKGLPLRSMNPPQQRAAARLLRASLSGTGYNKLTQIRALEFVLAEMERNLTNPFRRDSEAYYFAIFGTPSRSGAWGWRYEGHHASLHWTFDGGLLVSAAPQFLGASPAEVLVDVPNGLPVGTRVLGSEEDLARELVLSLSSEQSREAILVAPVPQDILTLNQRRISIQEDRGVSFRHLRHTQRELLRRLVTLYARIQPNPAAEDRLRKIDRAGWDGVKFAWTGDTEIGSLHYYRILMHRQFLIEYDTPMNEPFHRHTVWRDYLGEWGGGTPETRALRTSARETPFGEWDPAWGPDLLARHYLNEEHHHEKAISGAQPANPVARKPRRRIP